MTKAKIPENNKFYFDIIRSFSAEGFYKLDILDVLVEIGYSRTEATRLFNGRAIKIWDTRVPEGGKSFEWYLRPCQKVELVEPNDVLLVGKSRPLIIEADSIPILRRLFWWLRPRVERLTEALWVKE